jgi:hypothetical protein
MVERCDPLVDALMNQILVPSMPLISSDEALPSAWLLRSRGKGLSLSN